MADAELLKRLQSIVAGMKEIHKSSQHSDLLIKCQRREWKVHRAVVCPQSAFFTKALRFKEGVEGVIDFPEDEPEVVDGLVHYLYHFQYPSVSSDASRLPAIVFDLMLFLLADRCFVGPLKELAAKKFQERCKTEWNTSAFARAAEIVCTAILDPAHILTLVVAKTVANHAYDIFNPVEENGFIDLHEVLLNTSLGAHMAKLMHDENDDLRKQCDMAEGASVRLSMDVERSKAQLSKLKEDKELLVNTMTWKQREIDNGQADLIACEQNLDDAERKARRWEDRADDARSKCNLLEDKLARMKDELAKTQQKVASLEIASKQQQKIDSLELEKRTLQAQMTSMRKDNANAIMKVIHMRENARKLEAKLGMSNQDSGNSENEVDRLLERENELRNNLTYQEYLSFKEGEHDKNLPLLGSKPLNSDQKDQRLNNSEASATREPLAQLAADEAHKCPDCGEDCTVPTCKSPGCNDQKRRKREQDHYNRTQEETPFPLKQCKVSKDPACHPK